jgi:hypothetical protein
MRPRQFAYLLARLLGGYFLVAAPFNISRAASAL